MKKHFSLKLEIQKSSRNGKCCADRIGNTSQATVDICCGISQDPEQAHFGWCVDWIELSLPNTEGQGEDPAPVNELGLFILGLQNQLGSIHSYNYEYDTKQTSQMTEKNANVTSSGQHLSKHLSRYKRCVSIDSQEIFS